MRYLLVALLVAMAASFSSPVTAQSPPYLLAAPEIAQLRAAVGQRATGVVVADERARGPLHRTIHSVTGLLNGKEIGAYGPFLEVFYRNFQGPTTQVVLEGDRFLAGAAKRPDSFPEGAAFFVDMKTGHVAIGANHPSDPYEPHFKNGKAVLITKDCANPELRAFAEEWYRRWIETEYKRARDEYRMLTHLTTRCSAQRKTK